MGNDVVDPLAVDPHPSIVANRLDVLFARPNHGRNLLMIVGRVINRASDVSERLLPCLDVGIQPEMLGFRQQSLDLSMAIATYLLEECDTGEIIYVPGVAAK